MSRSKHIPIYFLQRFLVFYIWDFHPPRTNFYAGYKVGVQIFIFTYGKPFFQLTFLKFILYSVTLHAPLMYSKIPCVCRWISPYTPLVRMSFSALFPHSCDVYSFTVHANIWYHHFLLFSFRSVLAKLYSLVNILEITFQVP